MSKSLFKKRQPRTEPYRRLSFWRVLLAIVVVAGLITTSYRSTKQWQDSKVLGAREPWFASYVDVTAVPSYAFEQTDAAESKEVVLSFIVAMPDEECMPSWGGAYSLDQAGEKLDLDRRIERLRQRGGNVAISFGGLINDELAVKCKDPKMLLDAYRSVINRYEIDTIDLDLELGGLSDIEAGGRRAKVIASLQKEQRSKGKNLAVWTTLPVIPDGLTKEGTDAVSILLNNDVDLAGVNIMTMNYGESLAEGKSMLDGSKDALVQTHRQLGILYEQRDIHLNSGTLWSKIGATPMIGQNDITEEVFTLDDAKGLNDFAHSQNLGRVSMWSANRDTACGDNYVNVKVVSDSCSGVSQDKQEYAKTISKDFEGTISLNSGNVTESEAEVEAEIVDDPATSPYQIWNENGTYLEGTKVVWRRNVYEAKWWTQGDVPDNPVLEAWQTPWKLIGPVLPGEKPIKQATLPDGTYPEWSGETPYDTAVRVLFKGVPYQAKWWNKGESPEAASSNPDSSPWVPLTQAQINALLEEIEKANQQQAGQQQTDQQQFLQQ